MRYFDRGPRAALAAGCAALGLLAGGEAAAQTAAVQLSAGFMPDPRVVRGTSGGPVAAASFGSSCRGWFPQAPSAVLTTPTGFAFLRVFAESSADTTLMVRGPGMLQCVDDTYGLNPGLDLHNLAPGRYEVFVGSYVSSQRAPFALTFSELAGTTPGAAPPMGATSSAPPSGGLVASGMASAPVLDGQARPVYRQIAVRGPLRGPRRAMGRTNGDVAISGVHGRGTCRGYTTAQPSFVVTLDRPQPFLRFFVTSAADTTLVIQRPDGSFVCNDDTYGLHPSIEGEFPAGTYPVWVGIYRAGMLRPFRLTVTSRAEDRP